MTTHSKSRIVVAFVLAIMIAATGCSAQWINLALQDLPVLTQMALNVATLVSALASGKQASSADVAVIQNISAQASRDLNLLQTLYGEYKANPSATTLQKIQNVISDLNQNLPALLESAHLSNPTLFARIAAAVNMILTTVNSFAALIPQKLATTSQKTSATLPIAKDLKRQWNQRVCAPTGNSAMDAALRNRYCDKKARRQTTVPQEPNTMPLPVIAITNVSTCVTNAQVEAVLPALQKQVSDDFKPYWEQDCTLSFVPRGQPLIAGWWQIIISDNPDQAGALGYHELTSAGAPLGKVFAKLDLESGSSWTVTLSHELLEMLVDPGSIGAPRAATAKSMRLKFATRSKPMISATTLTACWYQISLRLRGLSPPAPTGWISRNTSPKS